MPAFGKSLESLGRRIRTHVSPVQRRTFRELLARGMKEFRPGEKIVCCDFSNPAIDAVGGRYYFHLVRDILDAGFFPVFTARRSTLSTFGSSGIKSMLLKERLGVVRSLEELTEPYFLITDGEAPASAEKVVRVDYEWRLCERPDEVAFPVFVHPRLAAKVPLPYHYETHTARPTRLFFGGNTEEGKYDQNIIRDRYQMLTRREMLDAASACFLDSQIYRPADSASWLASGDVHPFVLCETQHCKIPQERWLDAMAKADFFLACPGVGMPLCHNVIEALAAGCVPVLQYAAYLPEPLRDGVNCLAFSDEDSLRAQVASLSQMSPAEILHLRANARIYYENHLASGTFIRRLFGGSRRCRTLLLNDYRVPRSNHAD
jgi:hypothetical protein